MRLTRKRTRVQRWMFGTALGLLLPLLLFWTPGYGQAETGPAIVSRQPATLYTGRMNPVSAERILVRMPARRPADQTGTMAEPNIAFSVYRLGGQAGATTTPIYLLPDWSWQGAPGDGQMDELLGLAAIFGPDADVYIVEPRGLAGPDTDFTCPGRFEAPLGRTVSRDELYQLTSRFLADCLTWWQEAGMDPTAYSFAAMADDVNDVAELLGHDEVVIAGLGMGAFVGLHATQHEATRVARAILIRPPGIAYPFTRPDGLDELMGTLGRRAAVAPALYGLIPDLEGLLGQVSDRLATAPVAVTVVDEQTGQTEVVAVGLDDLRMGVGVALADGQAHTVPRRLFDMAQGDFRWLGEVTLELRRAREFDLAAVAALCGAGPGVDTMAEWGAEAANSVLGWGPFQLLSTPCAAFSRQGPESQGPESLSTVAGNVTESPRIDFGAIETPILFVTGDLDGRASAVELNAVATEHLLVDDLLLRNWTGGLHDDFWREAVPVMLNFLEDDYEAIPLASTGLRFDPLTARPFELPVWQAEYYNNRNLTGDPVLARTDTRIDFDWGADSPDTLVPAENFSVRWAQQVELPAGGYRFYLWSDDGARLWIDNVLILDAWQEGPLRAYAVDVNLVAGTHDIRYEYFDGGGNALARLQSAYITAYPDWLATYYPNPDLSGEPVVVRNEQTPNAFWGSSAPAPVVPAGNFSARWATETPLEPGAYTFRVTANGGARLYVNDELVIDAWENVGTRLLEANRVLQSSEPTRMRVEYFVVGTAAELNVRWIRRSPPVGPQPMIEGAARAVTDQPLPLAIATALEAGREVAGILWDMGDSTQYTQNEIQHTYAAPGFYDVTVVVTDSGGIGSGVSRQIRVDNAPVEGATNRPPVIGLDGPIVVDAGDVVRFDAGESLGLNPIVRYRWTFGDDTHSEAAWVEKVYQTPGLYNVRLRIEDDQGLTANRNRLVLVLPTSAEMDEPGLSVPIPSLAFTVPEGSVSDAAEGVVDEVGGPEVVIIGSIGGQSVLFSPTDTGDLMVNLPVNQSIVLDARPSRAGLDAPIVGIDWDIADGFSTATDGVIELVFAAQGQYRVRLTITDSVGRVANQTLIINVIE